LGLRDGRYFGLAHIKQAGASFGKVHFETGRQLYMETFNLEMLDFYDITNDDKEEESF